MTRVSIDTIDDHVTIWFDGQYHNYVIHHPNDVVILILIIWLYVKSRIRLLYDYLRSR
jgi:hypothetical protein